jgi:short-subunit dehydrogenase
MNNPLPFSGKIVWITGASSGIGEALSYEFSRLGATLILSSRNANKLEVVQKQLPRNPESARILPLDLEQLHELPGKARQALAIHGGIDILVNNAALAIRDFALNTHLWVDHKLMNINYFAPVFLSKAILPPMLEQGNGQVVIISSLSGKFGVPRTSAYAASKHALHGFFETLRSEVTPQGIDITMVVAGIIRTPITANALLGDGSRFGKYERTYQNGYPVEKAARQIVQATLKRKEEVFVGGMEGLPLPINRISPWLLRRIIRNHPLKWIREHFPKRKKRQYELSRQNKADQPHS